jgi:type IV secretory pathway VirB2 component (pilin)
MNAIQILQTIASFFTGQGGILLITIGIAGAGLRNIFSGGHHWGGVWAAIGSGIIVFTASWIVEYVFGRGGGGSLGI